METTNNPEIRPALRPSLDDLRNALSTYLATERFDRVRELLTRMHPAEIAALMAGLSGTHRNLVFDLIEVDRQHEVISEMEESDQESLIDRLDDKRIGEILIELDSDDRADLAGLLDESTLQRVLEATPEEDRQEVETLLGFEEDSAGGLMAVELVTVLDNQYVRDAILSVRRAKEVEDIEDIHYVYVVDAMGHLKGRIELMNLLLAKRNTPVTEILDEEMVVVHQDTDQEEVAQIFQLYDLISAPVVDSEDRLVGRITIDDIVDVVAEEASEDIAFMAGIGEEVVTERSLFRQTRARLPWLLVAFIGELIGVWVISHFEASLAQMIAISFFIPVTAAMAGNVGIQSSTIVIRGLATGEIPTGKVFKRVLREVMVAVFNGLILAGVLILAVTLWRDAWLIGVAVGLALVCVVSIAALVGSLAPFVLKRLGQDPALASGPFITMTNDVLGVAIYLTITSTILLH
ncbi:MAG: magnesium transporter [bacterium]